MILLRTAHFAVVIALAGGLACVLFVARPALAQAAQPVDHWLELRERLTRFALWDLALVIVSGAAWLVARAADMSGVSLDALALRVLAAVVGETLYGRLSVARLVLAAALGAVLLALRRARPRHETLLLALSTALAAALLASLAAAGHGVAEEGVDRLLHLSADALHLLAAGAWLGALPVLALVLARAARQLELPFATTAVRRFSAFGMASVAALALSGVVNAAYNVGSLPALIGTSFGRLLGVKLALFAAMVAIAAANRWRWTPRLAQAPRAEALLALARLRRNTLAETALGVVALGIAGALGVMVPAAETQTIWPFSRTLDWGAVEAPRQVLFAIGFAAAAALAAIVVGVRARSVEWIVGGIAVVAGAGVAAVWLLAVPAYPTTYLYSPVSYSVDSVARAAPLYAEQCALCHGAFGYGDGPSATALAARPPYLTARVRSRREGEILWRLGHVGGSNERLADAQRWDLLNYLRALANADAARRLDTQAEPWRPVSAPDFTFQIGTGPQKSLAQERGRHLLLLVFYSRQQSLARLHALAESKPRLDRLGLRVLAVPLTPADAVAADLGGADPAMIATPDASLVPVYAMFTRTIVEDRQVAVRHLEFLIDRQGYIRARSMEPGAAQWRSMADLLRQAVALDREKTRLPASRRHGH